MKIKLGTVYFGRVVWKALSNTIVQKMYNVGREKEIVTCTKSAFTGVSVNDVRLMINLINVFKKLYAFIAHGHGKPLVSDCK